MNDTKDKIRKFISEELLFDDSRRIEDDQPLVGEVLDSLALMQLVEYLEDEFHIEVADEDVTPENFQTLNDLDRYIGKRSPA